MKTIVKESISHLPGIPAYYFIGMLIVITGFIWNYWMTIIDLVAEWQRNPDYSAGGIVPFVAAYLIWADRAIYRYCPIRPCWPAILIILIAQTIRFYGLGSLQESFERYSFVLTFAGLVFFLGGKKIFYRLRWILIFLFLMVPFPGVIHNTISFPLQNLASKGAVFFLELGGVSVVQEGNVLLLDNRIPVAIVEACSGLRLLTAFIIVSASLAYLLRRSAWQKTVLLISSLPIAIFCNIVRLSATAVLYLKVSNHVAETFFHDFAGLTMMPMAVLLLLGEATLMKRIVQVRETTSDNECRRYGNRREIPQ
jgi:exosortase